MKNIVVIISGSGSNLQAILDECEVTIPDTQVNAVFSNKADAYGLIRAQEAGAEAIFHDPSLFDNRDEYDAALKEKVDAFAPDLVVLAGYMRILSDDFVRHFKGRLINIHPSLLPKYPGLNTYQKAIHAGEEEHGTSVHFVTEQLDGGPVILQAKVPIFENETVESLTAKVQTQEHKIYPLVVKWFIEGRLSMEGSKAILDDQTLGIFGYATDD
ncbi:phosphoribosylglycinamide formyltransferase [Vibrio sp.]|nr:phosphoribosylglycinamide formyltransferase [Vibrio sp.]